MPYLRRPEDDQQQLDTGMSGTLRSGGSGAAAGGGAAPGSPSQQAPSSVAGGNFVNLSDYLKANEGQGQAMADKVTGGIQADADKATGLGSQTLNPSGPSAMLGTGLAQKQGAQMQAAQNAESGAKLAGTEGGREQLLNKAYGSGASQGESNFNNALLGSGSGGKLGQLQGKYAGLSTYLGQQQQAQNAGLANSATVREANYARDREKIMADEDTTAGQQRAIDADAARTASTGRLNQQETARQSETGHGDQKNGVYSQTDEQMASQGGHLTEWYAAGSPPYDAWAASKGY